MRRNKEKTPRRRTGGFSTRKADQQLQKAVSAIHAGDFQTGYELAFEVLIATNRDDAAEVATHSALHLEPDVAVTELGRIVEKRSNDPGIYNDWGGMLCQMQRYEEAVESFRRSLELRPNHAATLTNLGQALLGLNILEESEEAFNKAISITPNHAPAFNGLGAVYEKRLRGDEAANAYERALKIEPGSPVYWNNLEMVLIATGKRQDLRERMYRGRLQNEPNDVNMLLALMGILHDQRRIGDALDIIERVLTLDMDESQEAHARSALAELQFLQGDYATAWQSFRWRWKLLDKKSRSHPFPEWQGQDLKDKTILVWDEQGVGERIMYARFLPLLIKDCSHVVLETIDRLVPIFQRAFPEIEVVPHKPPLCAKRNDIDFKIASGDLGCWFWDEFVKQPPPPTLQANPDQAAEFRARYLSDKSSNADTKVVGISWRSVGVKLGSVKSMQLSDLAPLFACPNTVFVDLQYGDTTEDLAHAKNSMGVNIIHDDTFDQLEDFDSFLSQIVALDAVISISNTTLHAAGALGIPTAGLLSTVPMWRWGMSGETSLWYPSVRLIRQTAPGDWRGPVQQTVDFIDQI